MWLKPASYWSVFELYFFLVHAHASLSRKGDRKSMELPGRTQGNPDGGLWAADIRSTVCAETFGGVEIGVDTKLKEAERACVENYRKMSVNTLLNKVKP